MAAEREHPPGADCTCGGVAGTAGGETSGSTRRRVLLGGTAAGAALVLPRTVEPARAPRLRLSPGPSEPLGPVESTTLATRILRPDGPGYARLDDGPGWPSLRRQELGERRATGAGADPRAVLAMVHLTDLHLVDSQSTGRVEFLDPFGDPFTAGFRAQEALTVHVASSMVERIGELAAGPVTGRRLDCAVSTGDNIDSMQLNEATWFLTVLDGGELAANSGDPDRYEGVQDPTPLAGTSTVDPTYWHPDEGLRDRWKDAGYPDVPGLLETAIAPFDAPGLDIPWYSTYGNHDGLVQGVVPTSAALESVLVGGRKMSGLPAGGGAGAFLVAVTAGSPEDLARRFDTGEFPNREVTPDPSRRTLSPREWVQLHLDSPDTPGPTGHGYTEDHLELPELHYAFAPVPGVLGISLDTGGYYSGSIGESQLVWLEQQLQSASSRWFDPAGEEVRSGRDDQLVMVFSHFNPSSMNTDIPNPARPGERRVHGEEVVALLHRYPNVIAWVNGHHHVNAVRPMPDPSGRTAGFWDVNTASHVDYPQQARVIEVLDNGDGTLSIHCTMVEHLAPARSERDGTSVRALASLSRELSANDPQSDRAVRLGRPEDLNVELVLPAPFDVRAAGIGRPLTEVAAATARGGEGTGNGGGAPSVPVAAGAAAVAALGAAALIGLRNRSARAPRRE